ncbi:ferric reductase-like transmembrane domain-containing protein [Pseudonocardia oceani]|uniref:ferric reductase-like transmembrane domain-containing protein n=1 Tax=Pseudonocardia oceani TaxID=2792013 RepID=UPI001CF78040|nr:ferric reductase-like transmembrane domain-containing protein [Pseudonocardia oceani]
MGTKRSSPAAGARPAPGGAIAHDRRTDPVAHPQRRDQEGLARHTAVVLGTGLLVSAFWRGRMDWDPEMRLWRAVGDASIVLLFVVLAMGPAAKFSSRVGRLLPWRRQIGIWAALTAVAHTVLILNGWVRWDIGRFLGYEFIPQLGRLARMEPGFGLANLIGLVAVLWLVVLAATSTDRALRRFGPAGWKWLHTGAYTVFYLSVLHAAYFLFLHYTLSFHRDPPTPNWFRMPLLALGALVLALQVAAFVRTVRRRTGRTADTR